LQSVFWASRDAGARSKQVAIAVALKSFTRFIVLFSSMVRRRSARVSRNFCAFVRQRRKM